MFARTAGLVTRGYHRYRYQPLHHLRRYHHHHSRFSNLYNLHPFFFFHQQQQKRIVALSSKSFSVTTSVGMAGVKIEELKEKLAVQLEAQYVDIEDLSGGCGQAFQAIIVSSRFEKKNMLARHRLVNSVVKNEIAAIHAWTPRCYTPEQWEKLEEEQSWK